MTHPLKITIAGSGYVGVSNAVLLAQHNQVVVIDIIPAKVDMINARQSPIEDPEIEDYLAHKPLNISATLDKAAAYSGADYVIIATPTDYDPETNYFNTRSIESVVQDVLACQPQRGDGHQKHRARGLYRQATRANRLPKHHLQPRVFARGPRPV
jgi:UDPglucose 6-dehydrogenase